MEKEDVTFLYDLEPGSPEGAPPVIREWSFYLEPDDKSPIGFAGGKATCREGCTSWCDHLTDLIQNHKDVLLFMRTEERGRFQIPYIPRANIWPAFTYKPVGSTESFAVSFFSHNGSDDASSIKELPGIGDRFICLIRPDESLYVIRSAFRDWILPAYLAAEEISCESSGHGMEAEVVLSKLKAEESTLELAKNRWSLLWERKCEFCRERENQDFSDLTVDEGLARRLAYHWEGGSISVPSVETKEYLERMPKGRY